MQIVGDALTFDDVLLLPNYSEVLPASACTKTRLTRDISLNIPLMSAAMDTVTTSSMAISMADQGGIGVLHKNMPIGDQAREVRKVKKFESGIIRDPVSCDAQTTVGQLRALSSQSQFSGFPVIDNGKLIGLVTNRDYRFCHDDSEVVENLMTPREKLIVVNEGVDRQEVLNLFQTHRIEKLPIVDSKNILCGMITVKDIMKAQENPNASKDDYGQLRVAAAVGTVEGEHERIAALIEAGVDILVVDTAHGYSKGVIEQIKWIKTHYPVVPVIAGNIATADAAVALVKAGADAVKVGMGPGSICTTRIVTGIGVPQITALKNVVEAMRPHNIPVIADGGIRYSGDLCKAIAIGADVVMVGGMLAGTEEAPGEVELYKGRSYKSYRGMGSLIAMGLGSADRYSQDAKQQNKMVPEGIEGRVPFKGTLSQVVHQLIGGFRSCMGYLGCKNITEVHEKARFVRVTAAGVRESHAHDVMITKEAPNYAVDAESV